MEAKVLILKTLISFIREGENVSPTWDHRNFNFFLVYLEKGLDQ